MSNSFSTLFYCSILFQVFSADLNLPNIFVEKPEIPSNEFLVPDLPECKLYFKNVQKVYPYAQPVIQCTQESPAHETSDCLIATNEMRGNGIHIKMLYGKTTPGCPSGKKLLAGFEIIAKKLGAKSITLDDASQTTDLGIPLRSTLVKILTSPEMPTDLTKINYYAQFGYRFESPPNTSSFINALDYIYNLKFSQLRENLLDERKKWADYGAPNQSVRKWILKTLQEKGQAQKKALEILENVFVKFRFLKSARYFSRNVLLKHLQTVSESFGMKKDI